METFIFCAVIIISNSGIGCNSWSIIWSSIGDKKNKNEK